MSENFEQLLEENLQQLNLTPGCLLTGKVVAIKSSYVVVDVGLKSEGVIPIDQFYDENKQLEVAVDDDIEVVLDAIEDGYGETRLSREKAKRQRTWENLLQVHEEKETVQGLITGKVKGGFTVEVQGIKGFLPGSLADIRPTREGGLDDGDTFECKIVKVDQKRNNIVVSRRAVLDSEGSVEREALLNELEEGKVIKGVIKNITDYGAFVDLGGVDGLLHITDMSWKRIRHPSEVLNVGDELDVRVLKYDKERRRVSLGLKQLSDDPWMDLIQRYPIGEKLTGKVTNLADYGFFVEIEAGIEGLVHISEIDWTNKNIHPSKVVSIGDEIQVMILEIDQERRRISLGMKQCGSNPWQIFAEKYKEGDKITGKIKSVTDFGIFIGLEGEIDGLMHISDISWQGSDEEVLRNYSKGQDVESEILLIDVERERISLGLKQMQGDDPMHLYLEKHPKGSTIHCPVSRVEAKGATCDLDDDVKGYIKVSEIANKHIDDARKQIKVGQELEVKIMGGDRKTRMVQLSIKAIALDEKEMIQAYSRKARAESKASGAKLGDILKEEIKKTDESGEK